MQPSDLLLICGMAAMWGGSFLFLRIATPEFGAIPIICVRVLIAAASLLPALLLRAEWRAQFRANFGRLFALGFLNAAIPFPLFAYATLHVTAGFASIINSTAPLFAAVVAWAWLKDRLSLTGVVGIFVGIAGVVILVGGLPQAAPGSGLAIAGALFASSCYGLAASFVKRYLAGVNAWVTTIGSFGLAGVILLPATLVLWPAAAPTAGAWVAVVVLAIACTSIPNIYYFRFVLRVGPARAMTVAFLIPVFGMLWGALFLGEQVTARMVLGCAVILLGTALVTGVYRALLASRSEPSAPAG